MRATFAINENFGTVSLSKESRHTINAAFEDTRAALAKTLLAMMIQQGGDLAERKMAIALKIFATKTVIYLS